jgi:hypothetical protein
MRLVKILLVLACFLAQPGAKAGMVEDGPFVLWINLSANPVETDSKLRTFLNSGRARCWRETSLLFMRKRPASITQALVKRALVKRDPGAIQQLNKLLKQPFDKAYGGFDGIVAYSDTPKAIMLSLTTGRRRIEKSVIDLKLDPNDFEGSFCAVTPEISRGP